MTKRGLLAILLLAATTAVNAQEQEKTRRPVRPEDYGRWESLGFRNVLSTDGSWLAYSIRRVNGESELCLRMLATDSKKQFPYGSNPTFSADDKWLALSIGVSEKERERLTKSGKPVQNKLALHDLVTGETTEIEQVSSFSFSESGHYLAMRHYPPKERQSSGADVVVRDLSSGLDTNFGNVSALRWIDEGTLLAMTIDAENKAGNAVRTYDPSAGVLRTLHSAAAHFRNLTWRKDAADLAALEERDHEKDEDASFILHSWRGLDDRVRHRAYDHLKDEKFPEQLRVVSNSGLRWSEDGKALFFGVKEWQEKPKALRKDEEKGEEPEKKPDDEKEKIDPSRITIYSPTTDPLQDADARERNRPGKAPRRKGKDEGKDKDKEEEEKPKSLRETLKEPAGVEVWHANDVDIIPRQKRTVGRDRNRSYLAAWWIEEDRFVQLGNEETELVSVLDGDRRALGRDNTPYEAERKFGPTLMDVYAIDTRTGERNKFLESSKYHYATSPDATYCLYLENNDFWSYHFESGRRHNLTGELSTSFVNDESQHLTDEKRPYGIAGWTEDASQVFLYDRYDIWMMAPDGSGARRLTRGAEEQVRYRRRVVDREEEEWIDPDRPMFLSIRGDRTKKSGFARLLVGDAPERLVWVDKRVGRLMKAEDADVYAYVQEAFDDSPDIFTADASLADARQVTETNLFQDEFLWGHSELVDFESDNGVPLQGALFYPADYQPGKRYPMVVSIYERVSGSLYRYTAPSERSPYNTSVFSANGYFVYRPDIVYRPQNPGLSSVECVVPAVRKVIETGMVDPDRIGLMGHSWGAYQTAFIVTQTDVFAAGVAGAPLTNMMSMSMSVYWNSGMPDAWIFHESQGRMDRPFWRDVDTYIKNSPIFSIDRLDTPLLITFGDDDGAVDFNQGVEMYNAARLAGKQLVMLVYPGENHGLRKKPNQVDYHYRILEWFGHYLKGHEPATWITDGKPHLERLEELEKQKRKNGGAAADREPERGPDRDRERRRGPRR